MVWLLLCAGLRISLLLGRTARENPSPPPLHHSRGVRLRGTAETAVSSQWNRFLALECHVREKGHDQYDVPLGNWELGV